MPMIPRVFALVLAPQGCGDADPETDEKADADTVAAREEH